MHDDLVRRLRNRRICIQQSGNLDDFPLLAEAADAIEELQADLSNALKSVENLINEADKRRWISVEETLPEENGRYMVTAVEPWFGTVCTDIMRYCANENTWVYDGRITEATVTHWMPLPELPKEET